MGEERRDGYIALVQLVGELKSSSKERGTQVRDLFELVHGLRQDMVTKADVQAMVQTLRTHMEQDSLEHRENRRALEHFGDLVIGTDEKDGTDGLLPRVRSLEDDRQKVRAAAGRAIKVAVGMPPLLAGALELWRKWHG